jgi:hypothetical protein
VKFTARQAARAGSKAPFTAGGHTVTATAVEQREAAVTKWLPVETEATP